MFATLPTRNLARAYAAEPSRVVEGGRRMAELETGLGCLYAGEPIPSTPSPVFLDPVAFRRFGAQVGAFVRLAERLARRMLATPGGLEGLGLSDLHKALIMKDAGRPGPLLGVARVDGFAGGPHGFRIVELNTDGSTGLNDGEGLAAAVLGSGALEPLEGAWRLKGASLFAGIAAAIRRLWAAHGRRGVPQVAVSDWETVKTRAEQEAAARFLTSQGIPARWVDPRQLKARPGGGLTAGGFRVDLIYKRVLTAELLAREAEVRDYLDAHLAGDVLQLDPFAADLVFDKGHLARLDTLAREGGLPPRDAALVRRLVPETRSFPGSAEDLAFARSERTTLVLKPRTEYGGRGVFLGSITGPEEWDRALAAATAQGKHLLQRLVDPMRLPVWVPEDGGTCRELYAILGVWWLDGKVPGLYLRAGDHPVINVANEAYSLPVLFASRRAGRRGRAPGLPPGGVSAGRRRKPSRRVSSSSR